MDMLFRSMRLLGFHYVHHRDKWKDNDHAYDRSHSQNVRATVGLTTTDGVYIDGVRTVEGDMTGPIAARMVEGPNGRYGCFGNGPWRLTESRTWISVLRCGSCVECE